MPRQCVSQMAMPFRGEVRVMSCYLFLGFPSFPFLPSDL